MNCLQENPYVLKESVRKPQIKASRLGAQGFHKNNKEKGEKNNV